MLLRGWLLVLRRLLHSIGSSTALLSGLVGLRLALQGQSTTRVSGQTAKNKGDRESRSHVYDPSKRSSTRFQQNFEGP